MVCVAYLIDTISCDTAGTQKQLIETIRLLDRARFEPYLICLWQSKWMEDNELPCPCTVLEFRGFLKVDLFKIAKRLADIIDKHDVKIVQTFFEDSIFVAFLSSFFTHSSVKFLSSRRDMGLGIVNRPWYHSLYGLAMPWVNRFFDGIIANSEQVREYVARREKTDLAKITVIRNGVYIPVKSAAAPVIFQQFPDAIWIGIVASLTPVKRHDLLIKALAVLMADKFDFQVLFMGEGPEQGKLETLARKLGVLKKIHFMGAVSDVPSYLFYVDIGVLCSDREGLSNAILEYMACGLPVIATAVGGNIELVDEKNGICVPPNNPEALANALRRMMKDQKFREQCGRHSLERIKKNYSWSKTITELQDYYQDLIMGASR